MSELQRRTEQLFRSKGFLTASVERRKRFPDPKARRCPACGSVRMLDIASDLWGVFDLIAVKPGVIRADGRHVFIQVTDRTSHSKRRNKILASAEAKLCLLSGCYILIQSWRKVENRWQAQDEWITLEMFPKDLPATVEEFYELQRKEKLPALPPGSELAFDPDCAKDLPF